MIHRKYRSSLVLLTVVSAAAAVHCTSPSGEPQTGGLQREFDVAGAPDARVTRTPVANGGWSYSLEQGGVAREVIRPNDKYRQALIHDERAYGEFVLLCVNGFTAGQSPKGQVECATVKRATGAAVDRLIVDNAYLREMDEASPTLYISPEVPFRVEPNACRAIRADKDGRLSYDAVTGTTCGDHSYRVKTIQRRTEAGLSPIQDPEQRRQVEDALRETMKGLATGKLDEAPSQMLITGPVHREDVDVHTEEPPEAHGGACDGIDPPKWDLCGGVDTDKFPKDLKFGAQTTDYPSKGLSTGFNATLSFSGDICRSGPGGGLVAGENGAPSAPCTDSFYGEVRLYMSASYGKYGVTGDASGAYADVGCGEPWCDELSVQPWTCKRNQGNHTEIDVTGKLGANFSVPLDYHPAFRWLCDSKVLTFGSKPERHVCCETKKQRSNRSHYTWAPEGTCKDADGETRKEAADTNCLSGPVSCNMDVGLSAMGSYQRTTRTGRGWCGANCPDPNQKSETGAWSAGTELVINAELEVSLGRWANGTATVEMRVMIKRTTEWENSCGAEKSQVKWCVQSNAFVELYGCVANIPYFPLCWNWTMPITLLIHSFGDCPPLPTIPQVGDSPGQSMGRSCAGQASHLPWADSFEEQCKSCCLEALPPLCDPTKPNPPSGCIGGLNDGPDEFGIQLRNAWLEDCKNTCVEDAKGLNQQ